MIPSDPDPSDLIIDMISDRCQRDANLVRFLLNRILKGIGLLLSLFSIPLLIYSTRKYIFRTTFHSNIKWILVLYFLNALFQAVVLVLSISYMLYSSFEEDPCLVYLPRWIYITGQLINFYLLMTQINLQTAASIERAIATITSSSYEQNGPAIGITFSILALLSPIPIGYAIYRGEDFNEPSPSVLIPPPSIAYRVNWLFVYGIFQCFVSLGIIKFLRAYNGKQVILSIGQVRTRFQTNENLATTSFITLVLSLQLSVFLVAGIGILLLRLLFFNSYDLTIQTLKTTLFLVPVFLLALPLVTIWEFIRFRRERLERSQEHMETRATGQEGIENYQRAIYDQW